MKTQKKDSRPLNKIGGDSFLEQMFNMLIFPCKSVLGIIYDMVMLLFVEGLLTNIS